MSLVRINDLAKFGVVADMDNIVIPPNAWTSSRNVRFRDGKVTTVPGATKVYDPPSAAPYWLLNFVAPAVSSPIWIYGSLTSVWAVLNLVHTNITRASGPYGATADRLWNGGILAGIPILNNTVDVPQFWVPPFNTTVLQDLTNWPSTWRCRVIRPYKNYLVALAMIESGTSYLHRLRWSHPAQPGGIPSSWDDADLTKDAGITELTDISAGRIVDGLPLGDTFIVYKERSIHRMEFIGGKYKMRFQKLFEDIGALGDHCVCAFGEGFRHFVLTGEDIIQHDGQTVRSVIDQTVRRWLLTNVNTSFFYRSFVVDYGDAKECWACIPTQGSQWPNTAIVWNYVSQNITFRDLDPAAFIWPGNLDPTGSTINSWARQLVQANPVDVSLLSLDTGTLDQGSVYTCYLERLGLSVIDVDSSGNPISDTDVRKLIKSITVQGFNGPITITVGRTQEVGGNYIWGTPRVFTPGTDFEIEFLDDGDPLDCRVFALRFEWQSTAQGTFDSYTVDVAPLGRY